MSDFGTHSEKVKQNWKVTGRPCLLAARSRERALARVKQVEGVSAHHFVHAQSNGIFAAVQRTWLCSVCFAKGTTRTLAEMPCSPTNWGRQRCVWFSKLSKAHKQAILKACDVSKERLQEIEAIVEAGCLKPPTIRNKKSTKRQNKKSKENCKNWRLWQGLPGDPRGIGGKVNARLALPKLKMKRPAASTRTAPVTKAPSDARSARSGAAKSGCSGSGLRTFAQRTSGGSSKDHPSSKAGAHGGKKPSKVWVRDLTLEGIHPHPGPKRKTRHRARERRSRESLKIWQLNIASFRKRGFDLIREAERNGVHVIMLQETRLMDREAVVVAGSLKNWAMFHQEEIQDSHARVEGGVAVLVRSDIPAIKAASWKGASGQWVRVCLPGLHVLSVYRTKGAASAVRDFNGSLSEECGSLGNVRLFIGGDFNGDPLVDGLNVLAAGFGGSVTYPLDDPSVARLDGEEFRGHNEMDHEYCPLPAATRWDSNNCIDWGIKARISVSVRVSQEKWSDHKVLQWDVFAKDFQNQSSKLRPVRNLRKPSSISDKAWQQAIEQCWSEATREEAPLSTWEDLTSRVEQAMTSALLRVQEYRKAPAGVGQKGMPAWVLPRFRHHREHHLGPQPVKTCRLRRLFRRLVAWQTQNNDSLRKSLLREGDFFNCPLDLTDRSSFERSKQWLSAAIDSAEEEQRIKNIKRWNDELRNDDGAVWKWLAKARLTERVHAVKSDNNEVLSGSKMFDELELFWRDIWPQDAQTRRRIADLCIASESSPWPQMQEECPLPSIKGTEIRARARKNKNKASGPCGWANTEIMFWPAEALDHLAILFQNIEEGTRYWCLARSSDSMETSALGQAAQRSRQT